MRHNSCFNVQHLGKNGNNLLFYILGLKDQIRKVCAEEFLVCGEGDEQGGAWQEKVKKIRF